ncbi:hypothetical protein BC628DRAFT_1353243 [Trametes gibbosa]|nr:hypothetical protein BC628DRAFT_1353243 [Trametes gibbosa]
MDYGEGLDLTSAEVSAQLSDLALATRVRIFDLNAHWYEVRNSVIDTVARTLALGLFTSIAVGTLYTVISKKWRGGTAAIILLSILPDCISTWTVWLAALSKIAHDHAMLGTAADDIGSQVDGFATCIDDFELCFDPPISHIPLYTNHGCVCTALIATDAILQVAALCGCISVYLLVRRPLRTGPKLMGALVFLPFLAACASAIMHVKSVCWPAHPVLPDGVRVAQEWTVSDPQDLDDATARLTMLTRIMSLILVASYVWEARSMYVEQLRDATIRNRWLYWLGVTFIVPVCVNEAWRRLCDAYEEEESGWPVFQHAFFSFGNAILVPLMDIYPGLAFLVQKIADNEVGDEGTVIPMAAEKPGTAETAPSFSPPPIRSDTGVGDEKLLPIS